MQLRLYKLNACDWYIVIGCLYYLQDVLYPSGIINRILQILMMLWALSISLKYIINFKQTPQLLNMVSLLVVMYTIYGITFMLYSNEVNITEGGIREVGSYLYLQNALNSLLPFYLFYAFAEQGKLTVERIRIYCFVFLLLFIAMYFKSYKQSLVQAAIAGIERKEFTNNTGYNFVMLMPILFFIKHKLLRYVMLVIVMGFTIMCMKRGAILMGGICFIWFLWADFRHATSIRYKLGTLFLAICALSSAVIYINYKQETSSYFRSRIEQTQKGNASGRNMIYPKIWDAVQNDESVVHLLIGRGANSTVEIAGNYAHHDWLELACNNGLIGVLLALSFYITIFTTAHSNRMFLPKEYYTTFLMLGFMLFSKTMFSMSIANMKIWEIMPVAFLLWFARQCALNVNKNVKSM